jgi:hypothetical protein
MGCDIHLFAEYETPTDGLAAFANGEFDIPRAYNLFAALAGVRIDGRRPLIEPRGVPAALTAGVFQHYFLPIVSDDKQALWRGFSYVPESEARPQITAGMLQFSAQQPATSWVVSELGYVIDPDAHSASFLTLEETKASLAHHSLAVQETPVQFQVLLEALEGLEARIAGARARVVFWFDN